MHWAEASLSRPGKTVYHQVLDIPAQYKTRVGPRIVYPGGVKTGKGAEGWVKRQEIAGFGGVVYRSPPGSAQFGNNRNFK